MHDAPDPQFLDFCCY